MIDAITHIVRLLRPQQWVKNLFVFLPAFFDGRIAHTEGFCPSVAVFVLFCLAASAVYCLNDIVDADADRQHPVKRRRPIASGAVSKPVGYGLMAACALLTLGGALTSAAWAGVADAVAVTVIMVAYLLLNVLYCLWLKTIAIVDVFIISTGYVLRVMAGGQATSVEPSSWLVLMTFLLALFLAFCKRRDDVVMHEQTGVLARRTVSHYNTAFIDQIITIIASILMVSYIMYTVSPEVSTRFGSRRVYMTAVFVLAGIIRYLQLTIVDDRSGSPTRVLLTDRFIHLCIVGWLLCFAVFIYL